MKWFCLSCVYFAITLPLFSQEATERPFSNPGVIENNQGRWIGSDYLGHLSNQIDVRIEIIQSQSHGKPLVIDENGLENQVKNVFRRNDIIPAAPARLGGKPPLPFFHVLIMVYAIPRNAYLIFCSARLFEEVDVRRAKFIPQGDWQAITWETQELVIAQKDRVASQLNDIVRDVATLFANRYRDYNPLNPDASPFKRPVLRMPTRPAAASDAKEATPSKEIKR